jgi:ribosome biogenesis protein YTM1
MSISAGHFHFHDAKVPSPKFLIPPSWRRYQLSLLINRALSIPKHVPFEFLLRG